MSEVTTKPTAGSSSVESPGWDLGGAPSVAVAVSTHNRSAFLPALLEALEAQRFPREQVEVVITDNGSTDDTWKVLGALVATSPLRLRAVRLALDAGVGTARDAAVQASRAPIVAFTDDDCLPSPGWLAALCEAMARSGGPSRPSVVQGSTLPWRGDETHAGVWARTVWVKEPTWLFETCNIAYRREDLDAVGGFSGAARAAPPIPPIPPIPLRDDQPAERTGRRARPTRASAGNRPFGEDAILGWAVVSSGALVVFAPAARVEHRHLPATYRDWLDEHRRLRLFPALLRKSPYGNLVLWKRPFLAPRTAAFDLMVIASAAAVVLKAPSVAVAGSLPWAVLASSEARDRVGRPAALRLAQLALGDLIGFVALVRGSLEHRKMVL